MRFALSSDKRRIHYYPELEAVRGFMAWWVVFGHIFSYSQPLLAGIPILAKKLLLATVVPVNVFICLSGFVIGSSLLGKSVDVSYSKFIVRRAFRIIPTYYLCFFLAVWLFDDRLIARTLPDWLSPEQRGFYQSYYQTIASDYWAYFGLSLTLLQGLVPDQFMHYAGDAFLSPVWSLSLEWQFYLVAPFLVAALVRWPLVSSSVALLFAVLSSWFFRDNGVTFSYGAFILGRLPFFVIGIASAMLMRCYRSDGKRDRVAALMLMTALSAVLAIEGLGSSSGAAVMWCLVVAAYVWASDNRLVSAVFEGAGRILRGRVLAVVGASSYVTYLVHVVVIDMIAYLMYRTGWGIDVSTLSMMFFVVAVVIVSLVASVLVHFYIEKPAIELGRRLTS